MGLKLTTDRYPPITSQTRYPLRHSASLIASMYIPVNYARKIPLTRENAAVRHINDTGYIL